MESNIIQFPTPNSSYPVEQFDGLSVKQINGLISEDFSKGFITLTTNNELINHIPIIKMIRFYLRHILMAGQVKLTKVGNLPPSLVKELYAQGYIVDDAIENGITKLSKETDCDVIVLARTLCEMAGLVKARLGVLTLTKKTLGLIESGELFPLIFKTMCLKFNWAYFDGYESPVLGQYGCNWTLYVLAKYGNESRAISFYAEKYFSVFPEMEIIGGYKNDNSSCSYFYGVRSFRRFLNYFGFSETSGHGFDSLEVKKTPLFDDCVKITV